MRVALLLALLCAWVNAFLRASLSDLICRLRMRSTS